MLCQKVALFLLKTLPSFSLMKEELKTCQNSNLTNFRRSPFGEDIDVMLGIYM